MTEGIVAWIQTQLFLEEPIDRTEGQFLHLTLFSKQRQTEKGPVVIILKNNPATMI